MYLNFVVGGEIFGIETRHIIQIVGIPEITETPKTPPGMKGFINLSGNVVPVISMRRCFRKRGSENGECARIIVVRAGEKEIGLIVDAIHETVTIKPGSISPGCNSGDSYIIGVARLANGRITVLLHAHRLFLPPAAKGNFL